MHSLKEYINFLKCLWFLHFSWDNYQLKHVKIQARSSMWFKRGAKTTVSFLYSPKKTAKVTRWYLNCLSCSIRTPWAMIWRKTWWSSYNLCWRHLILREMRKQVDWPFKKGMKWITSEYTKCFWFILIYF